MKYGQEITYTDFWGNKTTCSVDNYDCPEEAKKHAIELAREPKPLPTMRILGNQQSIFDFKYEDFVLENYEPHPHISRPLRS